MGAVRLGAIALICLAGLACKRETPGYCGGDGGAAKCVAAGTICNLETLLCEPPDGGSDAPEAGDGPSAGCRTDDACRSAPDAAGPACVLDGGQCVECLEDKHCIADKNRPFCIAQQCVPCTSDDRCPKVSSDEGLCIADGHCATADELIYVQNVSSCSPSGGGTAATPYCTAAQGIAAVGDGKSVVIMIGALDAWSLTGQPSGTTVVTVLGRQNATITANANVGIAISGAKVDLRRLHVTTGMKSGITASNGATLIVDRCVIDKFDQSGITITGSAYRITNSILTRNGFSVGAGDTIFSAVMIRESAGLQPAVFSHNTLVANLNAVSCDVPYAIDASIIWASTLMSAGNCVVAPCCSNLDPMLTDTYLLTGSSPCLDKVSDAATVGHDFEGQLRPNGPLSDCGADEYYRP
jgi:hypothetical protein